jgi:hypothetical protein
MKVGVDDFPNWTFVINEISAGMYRLQAQHLSGTRVDLSGTDPQHLIETAKVSVCFR